MEFQIVGNGIYTIPEAARYLRRSPSTLHRWFGSVDKAVFDSDYVRVEGDLAISFHDLIDAMVACHFREQNVSMAKVRSVYNRLQDVFGEKHAFCHKKLYTDGRDIYTKMGSDVAEVLTGQGNSLEVLRDHLVEIEYDARSLLAQRWRPGAYDGILIDPERSFGKPVVESVYVPTRALAQAYIADGMNAELTAELFEVKPEHVLAAYNFEESTKRMRLEFTVS